MKGYIKDTLSMFLEKLLKIRRLWNAIWRLDTPIPFKRYYENGQVMMEGSYGKNYQLLDYKRYYENGKLEEKCVPTIDESGKKICLFEDYYKNGQLQLKFACLDDGTGRKIGPYEEYNKNRQLLKRYTYTADGSMKKVGPFEEYWFTGNLKEKGTFVNDGSEKLIGPFERCWPNGKVAEQGVFSADGKKDGLWKIFDENSKLIEEHYYDYGKEVSLPEKGVLSKLKKSQQQVELKSTSNDEKVKMSVINGVLKNNTKNV